MIPIFDIGALTIGPYMLCALVGIFVAGIFVLKKAGQENEFELLNILLWAAPGVIIGGSLLYAITNIPVFITDIQNGFKLQYVFKYFGGSVFYGGMLGGLLSACIYCRIARISPKKYTDLGALFIPLFHFFGRIGCFLGGCCFGKECSIGFIYHYSPIEMANGVRRFPVQLVEALGELLIFLFLLSLFNKERKKGMLLSIYFVIYPILRFATEFLRGDTYRGFLFGFSTSQIISVILLIVGLAGLMKKHCAKGTSSETA